MLIMHFRICPGVKDPICWHTTGVPVYSVFGDSMEVRRFDDGSLWDIRLISNGVTVESIDF